MRKTQVLFLFIVTLFVGCANVSAVKENNKKSKTSDDNAVVEATSDPIDPHAIKIVVSIPPQKYWIKRIGGDRVHVVSLLSESDDFLTATALSDEQLAQLADARLYFKIGAPFESKLKVPESCKVFDLLKNQKLKPFSATTTFLNGEKSFRNDPYIWLSPAAVVKMLSEVYQGLRELDGDNYQEYTQNFTRLTRDLNSAEGDIQRILMSRVSNDICVTPPVLGYFCADFGLKQFTYDFAKGDPNEFARTAIENKIRVALFAQFMPEKVDARIAELLNGVVDTINPLAENYFENLARLAQTIAGRRSETAN